MVFLLKLGVMLKILSSEYQLYACGKIFRMPRSLRLPDLEQKPSFFKAPSSKADAGIGLKASWNYNIL
jgi:hypothetical protein